MISLRKITKPEGITLAHHNIILGVLGGLLVSNESIKSEHHLFGKIDGGEKVLDLMLFKQNRDIKKSIYTLSTKSMIKYLIKSDSLTIELPGIGKQNREVTSNPLTGFISKYYLYPFFADMNTIPDNILYMWNDLFLNVTIQKVNDRELNFYMGKKPMDMYSLSKDGFAFNHYTEYSRDKLLEKEIELGYINHGEGIGDKHRDYGYTHLLRANVGEYMTMPTWSIKLILNWGFINIAITARKEGKTSFAADRVVAELLSEKRGYGLRKSRRIKFFTDNASKVGNEVMQFIKDFMGELKNAKLKNGENLFDINDNKQEIVCNLTGSIFSIVSLKGLQGDSDNSTGDGLACDAAIIDEGFRIKERFWRSFYDRAKEETDWILIISTLNEETEINHWLYKLMIKGESGQEEGYNVVRSSDFDNSITYFNNYLRKGATIKDYIKAIWTKLAENIKDNGEPYAMKRMLCAIQSDKVLFDVTGRVCPTKDNGFKDLRIIGIDMGGLEDQLGVCIFNAVTLEVEEGYSHKITTYKDAIELAKSFHIKYPKCIIVGDRGGPVGEAAYLLDDNGGSVDYWIKSTGNSKSLNKKGGYYTLQKGTLVLSGAYALSNIVKIMTACNDLMTQFGDMEMKKSTRGNTILYKGKKGRKDDAVFAYLLVFGLLRIIFQLVTGDQIQEFAKDYEGEEVMEYEEDDEYYYSSGMTY